MLFATESKKINTKKGNSSEQYHFQKCQGAREKRILNWNSDKYYLSQSQDLVSTMEHLESTLLAAEEPPQGIRS